MPMKRPRLTLLMIVAQGAVRKELRKVQRKVARPGLALIQPQKFDPL
jgi:hypothetical protein